MKDPYCEAFPLPGVFPGTNGVISKGDGDPTVDIDSPLCLRTDISTMLSHEVSAPISLGRGRSAYPLITAAVVILFARFLCRLSSYRSVSSTISSEIISYH